MFRALARRGARERDKEREREKDSTWRASEHTRRFFFARLARAWAQVYASECVGSFTLPTPYLSYLSVFCPAARIPIYVPAHLENHAWVPVAAQGLHCRRRRRYNDWLALRLRNTCCKVEREKRRKMREKRWKKRQRNIPSVSRGRFSATIARERERAHR